MEKQLFEFEQPEKRKELLEDQADGVVEEKYFQRLNSEEIATIKSRFTQNSLAMDDLNEQKKEVVKEFKDNLKPLKKIHVELSAELRTGMREQVGRLYKMIDEDTRMVFFYDVRGERIDTMTRPATADELQRTIRMEIRKEGTNN